MWARACVCTQVLLKAREVSHSVRLLFGPLIKALSGLEPQELSRRAAGRDLLSLLLVCVTEQRSVCGVLERARRAAWPHKRAGACLYVFESACLHTCRCLHVIWACVVC